MIKKQSKNKISSEVGRQLERLQKSYSKMVQTLKSREEHGNKDVILETIEEAKRGQLTILNLNRKNISELPEEIGKLTKINSIGDNLVPCAFKYL